MIICRQGYGHFLSNFNNQDFFSKGEKFKMLTDGCSGCENAEVGTRLFNQLFMKLENAEKVEFFEKNVALVFEKMIALVPEKEKEDFISKNLLFTIIACFETEDMFIVKMIGDGYIIAENQYDKVSYLRFWYGKCPPYIAYNYYLEGEYSFNTYEFKKEKFKNVGISSDGLSFFVDTKDKQLCKKVDAIIISDIEDDMIKLINDNMQELDDDITILM